MRTRLLIFVTVAIVLGVSALAITRWLLPAVGAGALLFPARRVSTLPAPAGCVERAFDGVDVKLAGWVCESGGPPENPTVIYLHGIGDNRDTSVGVIDRFMRRGFDVVTFDSRGHGQSEGDRCTYGFFEKQDLRRVMDQAGVTRAVVIGYSLGGAVALQAAAIDPRISGVIAVAVFSDLRSIAIDRAPFVFTPRLIEAAFAEAERQGRFVVDEASPILAARDITAPVFIIHGSRDTGTRPEHSQRVYDALQGPKRLLLVPDAGHESVLGHGVWTAIENWIDEIAQQS